MSPECGSHCKVGMAFRAHHCLTPTSLSHVIVNHVHSFQKPGEIPTHKILSTSATPPAIHASAPSHQHLWLLSLDASRLPYSHYLTRQKRSLKTHKVGSHCPLWFCPITAYPPTSVLESSIFQLVNQSSCFRLFIVVF